MRLDGELVVDVRRPLASLKRDLAALPNGDVGAAALGEAPSDMSGFYLFFYY